MGHKFYLIIPAILLSVPIGLSFFYLIFGSLFLLLTLPLYP